MVFIPPDQAYEKGWGWGHFKHAALLCMYFNVSIYDILAVPFWFHLFNGGSIAGLHP